MSLHAVIFILRQVESTSDVNPGPEPYQSGTALTFPSLVTRHPNLFNCMREKRQSLVNLSRAWCQVELTSICGCNWKDWGVWGWGYYLHLSDRWCSAVRMCMMTISLCVQNFNSLLTEMITPQTYIQVYALYYIYIHTKPLPVSCIFGPRSGSSRIN